MNRRKILGSVAFAGLATAIPFKNILAQEVAKKETVKPAKPFKRFMLGQLELTIVSDGHIVQTPVQPNFAPNVPIEQVNKLLQDNFRSTEFVDLGMQILIIRQGSQLIMIDSGMGKMVSTTGFILEALSNAGFQPNDITDIVLTHGHPDHIGGLLNTNRELQFPNANLYIAQIEYDFWMKATPADFTKSELRHQPDFLKQILGGIKQTLTTVKPKLLFFKGDDTILDCIRLVSAPGHTPGLTLMNVFSGKEELLHVADLIHDDVLLFAHPDWGYGGDTDLPLAARSRRNILQKLVDNKMLVLSYHLPWPGLGHVKHKANHFEWIPKVYAMG